MRANAQNPSTFNSYKYLAESNGFDLRESRIRQIFGSTSEFSAIRWRCAGAGDSSLHQALGGPLKPRYELFYRSISFLLTPCRSLAISVLL
jgi:hypothetical protein